MMQQSAPAILVAMPNLNDTYFHHSVILLCEYSEETAFGVMINRPTPFKTEDFLTGDPRLISAAPDTFLEGGPVQREFLWGVHSPDFNGESTTAVTPTLSMSSVQELLGAFAAGAGPSNCHMGFGYAGWGPGQLDREIREGAWWLAPLETGLVLKMPYAKRWDAVIQSLGFNPMNALPISH